MAPGWTVLVVCVLLVLSACLHMVDTSCIQRGVFDVRPHPANCSLFSRCVGTQLYTFQCSRGTVFSPEENTCVFKGSSADTCRRDVNPICLTTQDTLIPHQTWCSLYYNCTAPAKLSWWEKNLQECDHPQVYNTVTRRCEHYSMVDCGEREMPLGLCEYKVTKCFRSHCQPCYVGNPSCRNLTNGLHADPLRDPSPLFIVCKDDRLVYQDRCPVFNGTAQLFDSKRKSCVLV